MRPEQLRGDPPRGLIGHRPDVHAGIAARLVQGVGEKAPIRRPAVLTCDVGRIARDQHAPAVGDLHREQPSGVVGEGDAFLVGRHHRREIAGSRSGGESLRRGGAVLVLHIDLILAAAVRDVHQPPAVGGPAGFAIVGVGGVRQIAGDAVPGRHVEDVAARHHRDALAARADRDALDVVGRIHRLRPPAGVVGGHLDRHRAVRFAAGVEHMQLAVQFVDDVAVGVGTRPAHVPIAVVGERAGLAGGEVVAVQIEHAAAVRIEINRIADPHRIAVGARIVGDLHQGRMPEVEDVQIVGPAALVALFAAKVPPQRRVHHPGAVRGIMTGARHRHGQRHRGAALHGHRVEPRAGENEGIAGRTEQDRFAVGGPAVHLVVVAPAVRERTLGRIERELARRTAAGRHDVHLFVAAVLTGERDLAAVGRELAEQFQALVRVAVPPAAATVHRSPA